MGGGELAIRVVGLSVPTTPPGAKVVSCEVVCAVNMSLSRDNASVYWSVAAVVVTAPILKLAPALIEGELLAEGGVAIGVVVVSVTAPGRITKLSVEQPTLAAPPLFITRTRTSR